MILRDTLRSPFSLANVCPPSVVGTLAGTGVVGVGAEDAGVNEAGAKDAGANEAGAEDAGVDAASTGAVGRCNKVQCFQVHPSIVHCHFAPQLRDLCPLFKQLSQRPFSLVSAHLSLYDIDLNWPQLTRLWSC